MATHDRHGKPATSDPLADADLARMLGVKDVFPVDRAALQEASVVEGPVEVPASWIRWAFARPHGRADAQWSDRLVNVFCWGAVIAVLFTIGFLIFRGMQVFNVI